MTNLIPAHLAHVLEVEDIDRDTAQGVHHGDDLAPLGAGDQVAVPRK